MQNKTGSHDTRRVLKASSILDDEILTLKAQVDQAKKKRHNRAFSTSGSAESPEEESTSSQKDSDNLPLDNFKEEEVSLEQQMAIELLSSRQEHLEQIQKWITTDGDLLPLISKISGNAYKKIEFRNIVINIILSSIFLIAGWLLSIVATPTNLSEFLK